MVILQIAAKKFHPLLYWATIIASTTAGTTMADFADRSLGIGYLGGSLILVRLRDRDARRLVLVARLDFGRDRQRRRKWKPSIGSPSPFRKRSAPRSATGPPIPALGYDGGALVFAAGLAALVALYFMTNVSRVFLFWAAFILTRPLGATVGDFLDKPVNDGGLALSRPIATAVIGVFIIACIIVLPQRAGQHPGRLETAP